MFCLDCIYQWNVHLFHCAIRIIHSAESNIRVEQYNFQKNKKRFQNLRLDFESLIPFRNEPNFWFCIDVSKNLFIKFWTDRFSIGSWSMWNGKHNGQKNSKGKQHSRISSLNELAFAYMKYEVTNNAKTTKHSNKKIHIIP